MFNRLVVTFNRTAIARARSTSKPCRLPSAVATANGRIAGVHGHAEHPAGAYLGHAGVRWQRVMWWCWASDSVPAKGDEHEDEQQPDEVDRLHEAFTAR